MSNKNLKKKSECDSYGINDKISHLRRKCPCGKSYYFLKTTIRNKGYMVCTVCGRVVFFDDKGKFKYNLKKELSKKNKEKYLNE